MLRFTTRHFVYLAIVLAIASLPMWWIWAFQPGPVFYFSSGWLVIIAIFLWVGNRFLTTRLDRFLPWGRWGNFRFFIHLLLGLSYLLLLINLTYYVIKLSTGVPPNREQFIVTNFWGAIIFVPVFSIYFSLHFLRHWRKSELDVEKFQKENIRSQLDSLKNHLDPHFLFNNLNILSSLVDKDREASKLFIQKFADVYRSILRTKSDDLIPLPEELDFIESYIYLIRTRFEDNIQFTMDFRPDSKNRMVPPLTLQMLIENAIKHNLITEKNPLIIQLLQLEDDYLIVTNTLNKSGRETSGLESGLVNIQKRYAHFTSKPVKIRETASHFEVHIPLLEIEHA